MSSNCDPMVYPFLFPRGDLGWIVGTLHKAERRTAKRQTVTMLQHYSYRLAIRQQFSAIHSARELFQQYLVDSYVKTDDWITSGEISLHYVLSYIRVSWIISIFISSRAKYGTWPRIASSPLHPKYR